MSIRNRLEKIARDLDPGGKMIVHQMTGGTWEPPIPAQEDRNLHVLVGDPQLIDPPEWDEDDNE